MKKQITAIVIDDDFDMVETFSEFLKIKGVDVVGIGNNGRKAVELYKKLKPDIVFSDVIMPDYDGFYALKNIREYDHNAKVIIVTSDSRVDTQIRLREFGASAVISKPYEMDDVVKTIMRVKKDDVSLYA